MKSHPQFKGVGSELPTTYNNDGSIDHAAMAHLVQWQIDQGIQNIFVNGISSECFMMTLEEQASLAQTTCATAKGKIPIMGNVIVPGFRDAIRLIHLYEDAGADAISITSPYFASYDSTSLTDYFEALIEATELPIYIYNAPETHNLLSPELVARLANKYPHVRGYKDSTQSVVHLQTTMRLVNAPGFEYIAGSDATIVSTLLLGGCGIISFISIAFPQPILDLCDAYFAGDHQRAIACQQFVLQIREVLRGGGNSAGYKYACELMTGCPIRGTRYPASYPGILSEEKKADIRGQLAALGLLQ